MERYISLILLLFLICLIPVFSDESKTPYYSIGISSGIEYPFKTDFDLLRLGMNVNVKNELTIPSIPWLLGRADLAYSVLPVQAETSLSLFGLGIGPAFSLEITPRFILGFSILGGGYYGFFNNNLIDSSGTAYENQQGGGAYFTAITKLSFYLSPQISLGIDVAYVNYFGLTQGLRAAIEVALHLDGFKQKVNYEHIEFDSIFPSQYKYYDENPAGSVVFTNEERFPARDVSISVFVDQYMDSPSVTPGPETLASGESFKIGPNILFSNSILELSEVSKVTAELTIDYYINGKLRQKTSYETLTLLNRNAVTWDDDRKAAAFVSPKSPDVLRFSKGVAGMVRERGPKTVNQNMRMAMGLFEALTRYGLSYVIDPNTLPYEDAAKNIFTVDFLQYPVETLAYKGGDCDDLSILYCSLLESIGVESAFITVPGHIFSAFSLDLSPDEAKRIFTNLDELIFIDDTTWIPIETTLISGGFYNAWQTGAKQWREGDNNNSAVLIPMYESWNVFESSGTPENNIEIILPDINKIEESYSQELTSFIDRELYPKIRELQLKISRSSNPIRFRNRLGILYAKYGQIENAKTEFNKILAVSEYVPTLINLGNLLYLEKKHDEALRIFKRAEELDQDNPTVLLNLARINFEFSNYALVNSYFVRATRIKPQFNEEFSYLAATSTGTEVRAEDIERLKDRVIWEEEEDDEE